MKLFPTKAQWKKWSLPSQMTAIGFYITIIPLLFSAIYYVLTSVGHWLEKRIDISSITLSLADIENESGLVFNHDEANMAITYPQLGYIVPSTFLKKINQEIESNVMEYIDENLLEYHVNYEKGVLSDNLISVKVDQYYYYRGAINGNHSQFAINITTADNRILDFFDIFDARRDALNEVKSLIKAKIGEVCDAAIFEEELMKASFIPRFFIRPNTIDFIFSEYEITPGVCGSVTVRIGYDDIVDYVRNDSPLGQLKSSTGVWAADQYFINRVMKRMQTLKQ